MDRRHHTFDFKLVHVPAEKHHGPDGPSRREPADGASDDEDDPEEWTDHALALGLWVVTRTQNPHANRALAVWTLNAELPPTSDSDNTFLINDKTRKADEESDYIRLYLASLQLPADLDDATRTRLAKRVMRFLIPNDRLWRRQDHGRHQLYILH